MKLYTLLITFFFTVVCSFPHPKPSALITTRKVISSPRSGIITSTPPPHLVPRNQFGPIPLDRQTMTISPNPTTLNSLPRRTTSEGYDATPKDKEVIIIVAMVIAAFFALACIIGLAHHMHKRSKRRREQQMLQG